MKNPLPLVFFKLAFDHATGHLNADTQHRLGNFNVLTLQERLGILGEIQSNQGTLILSPAQLNTAVWQLDNF
jgi:hypothetical protein